MSILLRYFFFFALPFSLFSEATESPQIFIGAKGGYQWALDDSYKHSEPNGSMLGIYSGLQFSPAWRWDIGYQYHDELKADATSINVKTWLIESALRYDWYLQDNLSLYGRLGAAYWDMEKTQLSSDKLDATGFSPLGEVGVNYNLTPNFKLSAGYQYIDGIGRSNTGKYDSHGLLIGLTYTFGKAEPTVIESLSPPVEEVLVVEQSPQAMTFSSKSMAIDFDHNSSKLSNNPTEALLGMTSVLNSNPQSRALIVGHTDSTGTEIYNQALSEKRARAVVNQAIERGVSSTQLEWHGEGESHPIGDNNTAEGRAQNRRVEVTIHKFQFNQE